MALFPSAKLSLILPDAVLAAGRRNDVVLVVNAPKAIPRAEHVRLMFTSHAWAGYGGGKSRSVIGHDIFVAPLSIDIPHGELPAGEHRFPFAFIPPAWLPRAFEGDDCGIKHTIEGRVDVDWAIDPTLTLSPVVVQEPVASTVTPVARRSPAGFHDAIVLELSLTSGTLASGQSLRGQVALRAGHNARFDAVVLRLYSATRVTMGRRDVRRGPEYFEVVLPAAALRSGEPVSFEVPTQGMPPTFLTGALDHELELEVRVDIPFGFDPKFTVPVHLLPPGSVVQGTATTALLGSARVRGIVEAMVRGAGMREGRAPVLVEADVGPVHVRLVEEMNNERLGIAIDFAFPNVELGLALRGRGIFDGSTPDPHVPASLGSYVLKQAPVALSGTDAPRAVDAFCRAAFEHIGQPSAAELTDRLMRLHYVSANDEPAAMVSVATNAMLKARILADAIAALPFASGHAASAPAWRAFAIAENAVLVASEPAIYGITLRATLLAGEARVLVADVRTLWSRDGAHTRVDIALGSARLDDATQQALHAGATHARLTRVRAMFPSIASADGGATLVLDRPGFTGDPRAVESVLADVLAWLLEVRGEHRVDSPYR